MNIYETKFYFKTATLTFVWAQLLQTPIQGLKSTAIGLHLYSTPFQNNKFVFFSLCESDVRKMNFNAELMTLDFYFILWIDEFSFRVVLGI